MFEDVGGTLLPLRSVDINPVGAAWDIARWRCDRRERRFLVGSRAAGWRRGDRGVRDAYPVLPGPAGPSPARNGASRGRVAARIGDRWRSGGIRPRLCLAPRGRRARCRSIRLPRGRALATPRLRFGRAGVWRVELRFAGYRLRRSVRVGDGGDSPHGGVPAGIRVLLTGDSMMLSIASYVTDSLRGRAETVSDNRVGTGLSKPGFDWIAHARRQMRSRRPDATVVFLGANDALRDADSCR